VRPRPDVAAIRRRVEAARAPCGHDPPGSCGAWATAACAEPGCGSLLCPAHAAAHEIDAGHAARPLPPSLAEDAAALLAELRRVESDLALSREAERRADLDLSWEAGVVGPDLEASRAAAVRLLGAAARADLPRCSLCGGLATRRLASVRACDWCSRGAAAKWGLAGRWADLPHAREIREAAAAHDLAAGRAAPPDADDVRCNCADGGGWERVDPSGASRWSQEPPPEELARFDLRWYPTGPDRQRRAWPSRLDVGGGA